MSYSFDQYMHNLYPLSSTENSAYHSITGSDNELISSLSPSALLRPETEQGLGYFGDREGFLSNVNLRSSDSAGLKMSSTQAPLSTYLPTNPTSISSQHLQTQAAQVYPQMLPLTPVSSPADSSMLCMYASGNAKNMQKYAISNSSQYSYPAFSHPHYPNQQQMNINSYYPSHPAPNYYNYVPIYSDTLPGSIQSSGGGGSAVMGGECDGVEAMMNTASCFTASAQQAGVPETTRHEVKRRNRLKQGETNTLDEIFKNITTKPDATLRHQLAEKLNMNPRAVQVWFQNRRAKAKREKELMSARERVECDVSSSEFGNSLATTDNTDTSVTMVNNTNSTQQTEASFSGVPQNVSSLDNSEKSKKRKFEHDQEDLNQTDLNPNPPKVKESNQQSQASGNEVGQGFPSSEGAMTQDNLGSFSMPVNENTVFVFDQQLGIADVTQPSFSSVLQAAADFSVADMSPFQQSGHKNSLNGAVPDQFPLDPNLEALLYKVFPSDAQLSQLSQSLSPAASLLPNGSSQPVSPFIHQNYSTIMSDEATEQEFASYSCDPSLLSGSPNSVEKKSKDKKVRAIAPKKSPVSSLSSSGVPSPGFASPMMFHHYTQPYQQTSSDSSSPNATRKRKSSRMSITG